MDVRRFATEGSTERPRAERLADLERLWSLVTEFCQRVLSGFNRSHTYDHDP